MTKALLFFFLSVSYSLTAQINNASFENWQPVSGAPGAEDPVGWTSNNIICDTVNGAEDYPIQKSTIAHTGNYALQVSPTCNFASAKYALLQLGLATVDSISGIFPIMDGSESGQAITNAPFILAGYYQQLLPNGVKNGADISIVLKTDKIRSNTPFVFPALGHASLPKNAPFDTLQSIAYLPFAIPLFRQYDSMPALNYMEIFIQIQQQDTLTNERWVLLLDDLSLHGNLLTLPQENLETLFEIYPNPAKGMIQLKKPEFMEVEEVALYNTQGQPLQRFNHWPEALDLSKQTPGLYLVRIKTKAGFVVKRVIKR
jgi:hypothetical protein